MGGELRFPAYISPEAVQLLEGLLTRDPEKRLGTHGDFEDLKKEPFFNGIDFDKLFAREIKPSFVPKVTDDSDISQIDPVFTQEAAIDSVVESKLTDDMAADGNFDGFTFVRES